MDTEVTISGQNFGATETDNEVTFLGDEADDTDDKIAVISTANTTEIVVEVPDDAVTGTISVTVDGETTTSTQTFTVEGSGSDPTLEITSIDPESGIVGEDVTISGQNFGATETDNKVTFLGDETDDTDDKIAVISTANTTEIVVEVPDDAVTGTISVTVDGETTTSQVFTVLVEDALAITDISPTEGPVDTEVTIRGQNFGATEIDNEVTFLGDETDDTDDKIAVISTASTTQLVVEVPDDAVTGTISVTVDGETTTSSQIFTVLSEDALAITDISPTEGPVDTEVTIRGQNFGAMSTDNEVTFLGEENDPSDDKMAVISAANTTEIVVMVPDDAKTGKISVTVDGETTTSSQAFTVLSADALAITDISPTEGPVDTEVTIRGQNFGSTPSDNEVIFLGEENDPSDDKIATISTANTTEIVVMVPDDAKTGTISVTVDGETTTSSQAFTVLSADALAITEISPSSGSVGENVTISGQNFGAMSTDNEVTFLGDETDDTDDKIATISTANTTEIVVMVPDDAKTGKISVTVDGETTTSSQIFTVLSEDALAITDISPTEGAVDTEVTIRGQNFGSTPSDNEVIFLGEENDPSDDKIATISTANTTEIVVMVPDDAKTGKISVTVDGETTTSLQVFTVRDGTEPPSPFSVPSSEEVIRVYPNPTLAELRFMGLSTTATYMYKLYSLLGQKALSGELRSTTIDVSALKEGQYILVLRSEDGSEILRTRLLIVR